MELIQLPYWGRSPQPSKVHFKRKFSVTPCGVFDEVSQTGTLYLYSQLIGKTNSNHITSILKYVVEEKKRTQRRKNRILRLNFDNCSVQKCFLMMAFACYLIKLGLYDFAEIHFRIAGHTKFSPDRMFAFFAEFLRKLDLFEVDDIVAAFLNEVNLRHAQKSPYSAVSLESFTDGKTTHFFDFKEFLSGHFEVFRNISKHQLFRARKDGAGVVFEMKENSNDADWEKVPFWNNEQKFKEKMETLPLVPLKAAKIKDLRDVLEFIPAGNLSYLSSTQAPSSSL